MPHTARNKRTSIPAQKRLQVTGDDGWTHVTSGSNVRRVKRSARTNPHAAGQPNSTDNTDNTEPVLGPAEAPSQVTLAELQAQYAVYQERWTSSETWSALQAQLKERMCERQRATQHEPGPMGAVDGIVSIGLGSPSGFLRDGWVDRRSVSMYQLAALESIKNQLSRPDNADIPFSFPVYAQDPVFNALDAALLESLGISVVESPVGFERVTRNTLLFCPGAERKHLELVLPSNPCLVFGGPLEGSDAEIAAFVKRTESRTLVPFSSHEHAFWKMRLYFREERDQE